MGCGDWVGFFCFFSFFFFFSFSFFFPCSFFFFWFLVWFRLTLYSNRQCIALLQGHAALVCQLQLSRDLLVTGGSDGRVITFSLETYKPLHRIAAHDSSVTSLQFDTGDSSLIGSGSGRGGNGGGSGEFLVTAGNDGRVKLWELATGRWVRDLTDVSASVWKVGCVWAQGCVAVMCRRDGKTVVEVWSMRPRAKGKEREVGGREKEKEVARVR